MEGKSGDAQLTCACGGSLPGVDVELGQQMRHMDLHGVNANHQFVGYFGVACACGDQAQYFFFPRCKLLAGFWYHTASLSGKRLDQHAPGKRL